MAEFQLAAVAGSLSHEDLLGHWNRTSAFQTAVKMPAIIKAI